MSTARAIAVVTNTLNRMLMRVQMPLPGDPPKDPELDQTAVTNLAPDKARSQQSGNQLNIYLYQVKPNANLRNQDMPGLVRSGETAYPPLAIDLYYLLTAWGAGDDDQLAHRALGWAMSLLHDQALLAPSELQAAPIPQNDLYRQIERVRITPFPLSVEDISKLWTAFATNYRLSVAYQVSVLLLDSSRGMKAPLPVLTRSPASQADTAPPVPPFPEITSIDFPAGKPSAQLGDTLTVEGYHLDGSAVTAFLSTPAASPRTLAAVAGGTPTSASFLLPDGPADQDQWVAGVYSLAVSPTGDPKNVTNALSFALAPKITLAPRPSVQVDNSGAVALTVTVHPKVTPEQSAFLLLGDRAVPAPDRKLTTDTLVFNVPDAPLGKQYARLRVDGIDSVLVDYQKMAFDDSQSTEIKP
jgi:hypothetical protein